MKHVMIFTPEDSAYDLIHQLGVKGVMQFDDLNAHKTAYLRKYASNIKKCEELERILKYIGEQFEIAQMQISDDVDDVDDFLSSTEDGGMMREASSQANQRLAEILDTLSSKEQELLSLNKQYARLVEEHNEKLELKFVLQEALRQRRMGDGYVPSIGRDGEDEGGSSARIRFTRVTGVIDSRERVAFERMVFRFSRGSCFLRFFDIFEGDNRKESADDVRKPALFLDPRTGKGVSKMVFIAVFPGSSLKEKLHKVCDAFGARVHEVPDSETEGEFVSERARVMQYLRESSLLLAANRKRFNAILPDLASRYHRCVMRVRCMKGAFHALNKCYVRTTGFVVARGWVLASEVDAVQRLVRKLGGIKGGGLTEVETTLSPPTFFRTNKFTRVFQSTVDIYGIPRYQEANPALFTAVTFPFLFGVMFGDVGHGALFLLFASFLVFNERALSRAKLGEIGQMAYDGRYMLLLMGAFAVYCGFIYNEFFCLSLDLFGSRWVTNSTMDGFYTEGHRSYLWTRGGVEGYGTNVYPFGIDPQWHMSKNELTFLNSFKMKLSVLLGITQMTAGIILKWTNAIHSKDDLTLIFECVPQLLFMCSFFVYMNVLIVYKWTIDWQEAFAANEVAPSLINTMINMGLDLGGRGTEAALYEGQDAVQQILVIVALLCIPAMLIPKPLLQHRRNQAASERHPVHGGTRLPTEEDEVETKTIRLSENADAALSAPRHELHHEESLMDLVIEQAIETIEFVLSCVSNTASYLRLWALSLAHAELAKTFWEMIMVGAINAESPYGFLFVTFGYAIFACVTFAVLLVMDPLECVLHALRLHWVEFQNKFYKADGVAFKPFCFRSMLKV